MRRNKIPVEDTRSKLIEITGKVQKLISLHQNQLELADKLTKENQLLKEELNEITQKNKELNSRNNLMALSGSIARTEEETRQLRNTINSLIREVDKCMTLINQ